jgi:hypothetical protein
MFKQILMVAALVSSTQAFAENVKFTSYQDTVTTRTRVDGVKRWDVLGNYNLTVDGQNAVGFCVDPFQELSTTYKTYNASTLDASDFVNYGDIRLNYVQRLFDNAYDTLNGDATRTAGFHLALWEIFTDYGNLNAGRVRVVNSANSGTNTAVVSIASQFLGSLAGWDVLDKYSFTFYQSDIYQDFLVAKPAAVPVPAALPLFLSAIAGFGVMRRRKNNLV